MCSLPHMEIIYTGTSLCVHKSNFMNIVWGCAEIWYTLFTLSASARVVKLWHPQLLLLFVRHLSKSTCLRLTLLLYMHVNENGCMKSVSNEVVLNNPGVM